MREKCQRQFKGGARVSRRNHFSIFRSSVGETPTDATGTVAVPAATIHGLIDGATRNERSPVSFGSVDTG
jgi:hypothetical protein